MKELKLSITEGGKEGKSKVIASCSHLEEKNHGMQHERRSRISKKRRNSRSGPEDKDKAAGCKRKGEEETV